MAGFMVLVSWLTFLTQKHVVVLVAVFMVLVKVISDLFDSKHMTKSFVIRNQSCLRVDY